MIKKIVFFIISPILIMGLLLNPARSSNAMDAQPTPPFPQPEKVEPELWEILSREGTADYVVEMADKADLREAYTIQDWEARGWYVYKTLKETAARSQLLVIAYLEESGLSYQSFFAGNQIMVFSGGRSTIDAIAALPSVSQIRSPRTASIEPIQRELWDSPDSQLNSLTWGIEHTGADDFWSAFSFQGEGIIVANNTGVQWNHPALDQSFKCGTDPTDPACWAALLVTTTVTARTRWARWWGMMTPH